MEITWVSDINRSAIEVFQQRSESCAFQSATQAGKRTIAADRLPMIATYLA